MTDKKTITDEMRIAKWRSLLRVFEKIISTDSNDKAEQLLSLKRAACNTVELTPRQVSGITDRCDNFIKGTYGNSKKPEHYHQSQ